LNAPTRPHTLPLRVLPLKLDRPRQILAIGAGWAICNFLFVLLRLEALVDLSKVQYFGVIHLLQQSEHAMVESLIYLASTFLFFYAIISRFHHAKKKGRVLTESFFICAIFLIIQGILLACQYPSAEALAGDTTLLTELRPMNARFFLLIALAAISHFALISTVTANVWQRKWHANNGINLLIGLPTALAMILMSIPPSIFDFGNAAWIFYLWFCNLPLTFAWSCATELRPPYLLKLS
jgi:hypothetical protein